MSDEEAILHVRPRGPYLLAKGVPVRRSTIVKSEHGEPMTYMCGSAMDTGDGITALCRCGASNNKPFCDGSHGKIGFQKTATGDET